MVTLDKMPLSFIKRATYFTKFCVRVQNGFLCRWINNKISFEFQLYSHNIAFFLTRQIAYVVKKRHFGRIFTTDIQCSSFKSMTPKSLEVCDTTIVKISLEQPFRLRNGKNILTELRNRQRTHQVLVIQIHITSQKIPPYHHTQKFFEFVQGKSLAEYDFRYNFTLSKSYITDHMNHSIFR